MFSDNQLLLRFLRLSENPDIINNACIHGIIPGINWCHGIFAVPKKSHPHPKGSENDWIIKVIFTESIGITNAIHNISPRGKRLPADFMKAFLESDPIPEDFMPNTDKK
jgi:hypothetical protein